MLEYWYKQKRTLVDFRRGPLGPHFDGFAAYLKAKKYSHDSGKAVLGKCCQFNWFLMERGIVSAKEIREPLIDSFLEAYYAPPRAAGPRYSPKADTRLALKHLLAYLAEVNVWRPPKPEPVPTPYTWLLNPYLHYLQAERELSPKTIAYRHQVLDLFLGRLAHGSDGGGSIRIPASCCGVFGFKPTRDRVPLGPRTFQDWNGCDHQHALTVSVRDSAALLDATGGQELGSPFFSPKPERPFLDEVAHDPGSLRIALVAANPIGNPVDPECQRAVLGTAKLCENLGHQVEETKLPINPELLLGAFFTIVQVSVARTLDEAASTLGRPITQEDVETVTWAMAQAGSQTSGVAYSQAITALHQIGLSMAKFQHNYDVILSPTLSKPPVPLGVVSLSQDPSAYRQAIKEFAHSTSIYNATGQPSMSVPLHWTPDDLPVGVMFSGRFGEDASLFRLAAQLERAQPWANRRPRLR